MLRVIVLYLLSISVSHAYIFTLDPDDYAAGTDLTNVAPGLTLRTFHHNGGNLANATYNPTYSRECAVSDPPGYYCGAHEGTRDFGTVGGLQDYERCVVAPHLYCYGFNLLDLTFDSPTDFLQIEARAVIDPPMLIAFDILGNELFRCLGSEFGAPLCEGTESHPRPDQGMGYETTWTLARSSPDIARVLVGGWAGSSQVGEISYNVPATNVPEPSTMALLGMGLFGVGLARRRRVRH